MAPKKDKGKSKEIVSRGSTNRRATRSSSNRGREQTPSPPRSPESPPSTPPSSSDSEERQIVRKPRTNSMGKFGEKRRTKPNRVDMHGGRIFDDTAKKTLLAIIRDQWPNNLYTYTDIIAKDPRWMAEVVTEFKYFYKNLRGQSRVEATYSIEDHVKRTCKRLMNEEKDRLKKRMKDTGLSANELRPSYINPILWGNLLKYWDSDSHKHRSDVGAKNRKKVLTLHSAGAKSFEDIEMEMTKKNKGKKPRRLDLWDRTHTTAASRRANKGKEGGRVVYTTPEAMEIASRYGAILEREGVDLTPETELTEPIQWWLEATTGGTDRPIKNRIIGFPGVPASTLLPNLAHRYRERTRGGAGSSSSAPNHPSNIPDQLFVQVVRHAVTSAQTDPGAFQRQLENRELEDLARNLLEVSNPESEGNFNNVFFREVVSVVTTIMNDICNKYETATQEAIKASNHEFTDGDSSENEEPVSDDDADGRNENDHGDAAM